MKLTSSRILAAIARDQHSLLTRADVLHVTGRPSDYDALVRGGFWREILPGVLAPAGCATTVPLMEAAAMLWDPHCLLSHHSAARRDGFWVPDSAVAHITVPWGSALRSTEHLLVTRTRVRDLLILRQGLFRWTAGARTVADLASLLERRPLESVLLSAIRNKRATAASVAQAAAPLVRRKGTRELLALTQLWTPERESLLEDGLHADVRAVVAEEVTRQHVVRNAQGFPVARLDVAIEELLLGFEADGLHFH